jgi:hypothetical protein
MATPLNNQLKMFMSPREVLSGWQPLDGDRDEAMDPRGGDLTGRPYTTMGATNRPNSQGDYHRPYEADPYGSNSETDNQLWSRKLDESQMSANEYGEIHDGQGSDSFDVEAALEHPNAPQYHTGHTGTHEAREDSFFAARVGSFNDRKAEAGQESSSLYNSVRGGGVQSPVHLGTQFGSQGKPQVVGGHHRIAAQNDIDQDALMPVLHHESIRAARSTPGYKYS